MTKFLMRELDFVDEYYKNKDLSLLKKLTLVIPTYNRNYYLSRCLWYHAHFPFGQIIAADSSPDDKKIINRKTVEKVRETFGANILYLEYLPEIEKLGGDIYRKWADAVHHAATEYCVICSDKEFLIPSATNTCLNYLENNTDYSIADGKYYYIETAREKRFRIRNMYPSKKSLNDDSAISRLINSGRSKNQSSNLTCIRRTELYKKLYKTLSDNKIDDIRFGEFTLEFLTIIKSKSFYYPEPLRYRDISNLITNHKLKKIESSSLRYPNLEDYKSEGIYDDYFSRFTKCISNEISENEETCNEDLQKLINNTLLPIIQKRGFFGNTKFLQDPLWYLWRHLPWYIKDLGGKIIPNNYLEYTSNIHDEAKIIIKLINDTIENSRYDNTIINNNFITD